MLIVFSYSKMSESRHLGVSKAEGLMLAQLYSSQHYHVRIASVCHQSYDSPALHRSLTLWTQPGVEEVRQSCGS